MEALIFVLLVSGAGWLALQYLPVAFSSRHAPVTLAADVRKYIDNKIIAGAAGSQCAEVPKLVGRVAELEARLADLNRFHDLRREIDEKRAALEQLLADRRQEQFDLLNNVRTRELALLKNKMAVACAGFTVRPGEGDGRSRSSSGGQNSMLKNLGVDEGAPAPRPALPSNPSTPPPVAPAQ